MLSSLWIVDETKVGSVRKAELHLPGMSIEMVPHRSEGKVNFKFTMDDIGSKVKAIKRRASRVIIHRLKLSLDSDVVLSFPSVEGLVVEGVSDDILGRCRKFLGKFLREIGPSLVGHIKFFGGSYLHDVLEDYSSTYTTVEGWGDLFKVDVGGMKVEFSWEDIHRPTYGLSIEVGKVGGNFPEELVLGFIFRRVLEMGLSFSAVAEEMEFIDKWLKTVTEIHEKLNSKELPPFTNVSKVYKCFMVPYETASGVYRRWFRELTGNWLIDRLRDSYEEGKFSGLVGGGVDDVRRVLGGLIRKWLEGVEVSSVRLGTVNLDWVHPVGETRVGRGSVWTFTVTLPYIVWEEHILPRVIERDTKRFLSYLLTFFLVNEDLLGNLKDETKRVLMGLLSRYVSLA
ncbi:MAG: hypothetical protein QW815_01885 [Nitrososphaerota archaeon]